MALNDLPLPAIRQVSVPAKWQPPVGSLVARGVAVVAAGTIAEWLARRALRSAAGKAARLVRLPSARAKDDDPAQLDGTNFVSDTLFIRRVRMRR
jgi:hypothetical protein